MARVSSAPEDAYHLSGKFADGWGKVTDCKVVMFQYPPMKEAKGNRPAGHQDPAALVAELTIQRYVDGDGNVAASQPETKMLGIQKGTPGVDENDNPIMVYPVHPGKYPDDNPELDPVDCGDALGAEGNTLFALQDGFALNDKCGWMVFTQSLQEDGFKPAILKRTFFDDLIGLYAYFVTETRPKFRQDQTEDPTAFVVKKGTTRIRPYEKQTAGAAAGMAKAAKGAAAGGAKKTAAAAPKAPVAPATSDADSNGAADPETLATSVLKSVAGANKGTVYPNATKLSVQLLLGMNKLKPPIPAELKKAVQDQLKDSDWVAAVGMGEDVLAVNDDGSIQFAD